MLDLVGSTIILSSLRPSEFEGMTLDFGRISNQTGQRVDFGVQNCRTMPMRRKIRRVTSTGVSFLPETAMGIDLPPAGPSIIVRVLGVDS
jgi:hypothetical protein